MYVLDTTNPPHIYLSCMLFFFFFFFNDTATTEIYTLSLHDALPIWTDASRMLRNSRPRDLHCWISVDRKSTRLNSSHHSISYAVFCLKKNKKVHSRPSHLYTRRFILYRSHIIAHN